MDAVTPHPGERAGGPRPSLPDDPQRARVARRREGRLAGLLFIACPLAAIPSSFLIEPPPPASLYLVGAASVLAGLVCMALPWERVSRLWLYLLGVFAIVEVTVAIGLSDDFYVFFYFFIAVFAAYVAENRTELVLTLGLVSLGLLSPVVYDPGGTHEDTARLALLAIPALSITAGLVFYLRERLEAERLAYRTFAEEALELTSRIRGVELDPRPAVRIEPAAVAEPDMPERWRAPVLAAVAVIVGVPLVSAGLAAAGVALPGAVREPFEQLGIELPNQDQTAASTEPLGAAPSTPVPAVEPDSRSGAGARERGAREEENRRTGRPAAAEQAGPADPGATAPSGAPGDAVTDPTVPAPESPSAPATPAEPGEALRDTLDDRLRDTLGGVDRLLDDLGLNRQEP